MEPPNDPDIESLDAEGIQQLNPLDRHRIRIRWAAIGVAIIVILAIGAVEFYILKCLTKLQELGDLGVLLAISPILSITVIVTFILIGSFKRSADSEINLPVGATKVAQVLTGSSE